ncbi:MAG TPA: diaminopimelate decarboxylase [Gemmatimonadaceae bacterium]|nr:diaminopimelate decarboxylase [Gemmatimonadaceae bacterium]
MGPSLLTPALAPSPAGLACDGVPLARIAEAVGTPTYVYSARVIREQYARLADALAGVPHRVHYSVKANSSLAVLDLLRRLGAGVDIVSGGELHRALCAGFSGADIVFSGVGKTDTELWTALHQGVGLINVESEGELRALSAVAERVGVDAPVALRVNPEVEVDTPHHYTRTGGRGHKFGVPYDEVVELAELCARLPRVRLEGLDMHVGSQLTRMEPYEHGVARLLDLLPAVRAVAGDTLRVLDLGGGLAVSYGGEAGVDLAAFGDFARTVAGDAGLPLIVEPGRFLVAEAGVLLTRVLYRKRSGGKEYVIADAGMTELLRPSHYQAYHHIDAVVPREGREVVDVVGPVCESGDFLALDRELDAVAAGDLLAVRHAGAYGFVMASNYNSRPRPAEVLVNQGRFGVVTARERYEDLTRHERLVPDWEE